MSSARIGLTCAALLPTLILSITACSKPKGEAEPSLAQLSTTSSPSRKTDRSSTESDDATRSEAPYELQFIDTMIRHHRDAIEVGQVAGRRARHTELREATAKLAAGHERQVVLMTSWRDEWYAGKTNAENFDLPGMTRLNTAQLDSLSDEEFDLTFIDMMIPHHQGGIVMAKEAIIRVEHAELKALSQQIIDVQQQEVDRLTRIRSGS